MLIAKTDVKAIFLSCDWDPPREGCLDNPKLYSKSFLIDSIGVTLA